MSRKCEDQDDVGNVYVTDSGSETETLADDFDFDPNDWLDELSEKLTKAARKKLIKRLGKASAKVLGKRLAFAKFAVSTNYTFKSQAWYLYRCCECDDNGDYVLSNEKLLQRQFDNGGPGYSTADAAQKKADQWFAAAGDHFRKNGCEKFRDRVDDRE